MDCSQYFVMFVISQRPLPKCAISQAATSQDCANRSARPPLQSAAPQKAYPDLWEVAAWEIAHLGNCTFRKNCHLESRPWENAYGKVPNISNRLLIINFEIKNAWNLINYMIKGIVSLQRAQMFESLNLWKLMEFTFDISNLNYLI